MPPPRDDTLPDLYRLMDSLEEGETDLVTKRDPPALFTREEHVPKYEKISGNLSLTYIIINLSKHNLQLSKIYITIHVYAINTFHTIFQYKVKYVDACKISKS